MGVKCGWLVSGWLVGWWMDSKSDRVGKPDWTSCRNFQNRRSLPLVCQRCVVLVSQWSCGSVGEADRVRILWVGS